MSDNLDTNGRKRSAQRIRKLVSSREILDRVAHHQIQCSEGGPINCDLTFVREAKNKG